MLLTIDHINDDGWQDRDTSLYAKLIRENFPPGFQTLCYNCNIGKYKAGGICPHILENPELVETTKFQFPRHLFDDEAPDGRPSSNPREIRETPALIARSALALALKDIQRANSEAA